MSAQSTKLYEFIKREGPSLFDGAHAVYTPQPLVDEIVGKINVTDKTILVLFNMEFVVSLIYTYKVAPSMITVYVDHENKSKFAQRMGVNCITNLDVDMKFDVVVGNPPYQDGSKEGGQNKIYNLFSKKSIDLLNEKGVTALITPTSVLKKSKRFSLINQQGLKDVDFTTDNHFNVGIKICSWIIDKTYESTQVTVLNSDRTVNVQQNSNPIYDYTIVDKDFTLLYNKLKQETNTPDKRMFKENNFGDAVSKQKSKVFTHTLYSVDKEGNKKTFGYSKRVPYFYNKTKIVIPMTKTLTDDSILSDTNDFYVAYLCTDITNDSQVDNIKSFILSDYFKQHSKKWRELDGYGFNYALKYLPPFNKNKKWKNEEVKEFLESFLNVS